jgi:hypothetical protein
LPCVLPRIQFLRDLYDFFSVRFKIAPLDSPLASNAVADSTANDGEATASGANGEEDGDSSSEGSETEGQVVLGMQVNEVKRSKGEEEERSGIRNGKYRPKEFMVSCVGMGYGNINRSAA